MARGRSVHGRASSVPKTNQAHIEQGISYSSKPEARKFAVMRDLYRGNQISYPDVVAMTEWECRGLMVQRGMIASWKADCRSLPDSSPSFVCWSCSKTMEKQDRNRYEAVFRCSCGTRLHHAELAYTPLYNTECYDRLPGSPQGLGKTFKKAQAAAKAMKGKKAALAMKAMKAKATKTMKAKAMKGISGKRGKKDGTYTKIRSSCRLLIRIAWQAANHTSPNTTRGQVVGKELQCGEDKVLKSHQMIRIAMAFMEYNRSAAITYACEIMELDSANSTRRGVQKKTVDGRTKAAMKVMKSKITKVMKSHSMKQQKKMKSKAMKKRAKPKAQPKKKALWTGRFAVTVGRQTGKWSISPLGPRVSAGTVPEKGSEMLSVAGKGIAGKVIAARDGSPGITKALKAAGRLFNYQLMFKHS